MINLEEAIKIAETERNSKVVCANDCDDRWAFGFEDDSDALQGMPIFVYKKNGNVEYFLTVMLVEAVERGEMTCKSIRLPNKKTPDVS